MTNPRQFWQIAALAALLAGFPGPARLEPAQTEYRNTDYGFAVAVPRGVQVQTTAPPSPNHGFKITLGEGRVIYVQAIFDAAFLGSADAALRNLAQDAGVTGALRPTTLNLSGLTAERAAATAHGRIIDLVVAFRSAGAQTPIIYSFELDTDAATRREDADIFGALLHGFSILPLPS